MKANIKNILYISLISSASIIASCTKSFEDINTNPNSPVEAPATNVLGWVIQQACSNIFGDNEMSEHETYAGHIGKIQYVDESRYMYADGTVLTSWNLLFRLSVNLQKVIDVAHEQGNSNMEGVAMLLQSYIQQVSTDAWRDIPYAQALKGDSGYITPSYDKQETIYPTIISRYETAANLLAQGGKDDLGSGDLLFKGDVSKWQKLCNALRVRIAMRISNVNFDLTKSIIESIINNPEKYPLPSSINDNAYMNWLASTPYQEPWYNNSKTRNDHGMGKPFIDTLLNTDDPRIAVYAKKADDGVYRGITIGVYGVPTDIGQYSLIGALYRDNPQGFSPIFRYSELCLLLSEASQKGISTNESSENLYNKGISASFAENGITDIATINTYVNSSIIKFDGSLNKIYRQQWITLFKDGHEGWALERRTDYPALSAAPGSPYQGHNRPPFRYPYPSQESTLNKQNSAPFVALAVDNFWGEKMYWDVRNNVQ